MMTVPMRAWEEIDQLEGDDYSYALENHNEQLAEQKYQTDVNYRIRMEELLGLIKGDV